MIQSGHRVLRNRHSVVPFLTHRAGDTGFGFVNIASAKGYAPQSSAFLKGLGVEAQATDPTRPIVEPRRHLERTVPLTLAPLFTSRICSARRADLALE